MSEFNIFEEVKQGEFFSFKNVGDSIQGTYISASYGVPDGFNNMQNIYTIQDADGKVWNIGFKLSNEMCNERMTQIKFGQIVGFRFDEERESKKNPGMNKAKIIRIYADPKFIDTAWLAQQKELGVDVNFGSPEVNNGIAENSGAAPLTNAEGVAFSIPDGFFKAPADATPVAGGLPTAETVIQQPVRSEAINAIMKLALTKGLVEETMTQEEADAAVEKYTGLPLTEENLTRIIIALTSFVKA